MVTNIFDHWFHINVIHDADLGLVYFYYNGSLIYTANDRGYGDHYFKCGVYTQEPNASDMMEVYIKNINIYKAL